MTKRKKISAIVACYRDEQAVPFMYQRLVNTFKKIKTNYEIIFVNDCSPDNTREVLESLASNDSKVIIINHTRNFGSQNAFSSGMKIATGNAAVLLDGDLQDPPELIEAFYKKWLEGFDVIYGIRVKRKASFFMNASYKLFYKLFKIFAYINIPLDAGDFSLIDRRVVNEMNQLSENNRFIRGLRAWVGFKQTGVPYVRPERMFGRTTNSFLKNIMWAQKGIFSFSYVPLQFITILAFIFVIFSALAAMIQILIRIFFPQLVVSGITTLIVLIFFLGGIQLLCLGIIGVYLGHIYDEVKHRPPYIVDNIINNPRSTSKKVIKQ